MSKSQDKIDALYDKVAALISDTSVSTILEVIENYCQAIGENITPTNKMERNLSDHFLKLSEKIHEAVNYAKIKQL